MLPQVPALVACFDPLSTIELLVRDEHASHPLRQNKPTGIVFNIREWLKRLSMPFPPGERKKRKINFHCDDKPLLFYFSA